jgi:FtsH-binding integral membrane protein
MSPHYRHTQVGWIILGLVAAILAFVWSRLPPEAAAAALFPLLLITALTVLVFSVLTVEVDAEAIRLRFGIGLVRKRIPLAEVKAWRAVRNPWYTGWGIRLGSGYVLWNVSGFDAVELDLATGRRFRVGTDEPAALVSAIERVRGEAVAVPAADGRPLEPSGGVAWKGWVIAFALVGALFGGLFWSQLRPARVAVTPGGFVVDTLIYGDSFSAAEITAVSLEGRLPRVLLRTNGFAGAGSLRGHFRVEGLGDGRLYVEEGFAPFVLVRLRQGFVVVNYREPERTMALYDEMARAWPDRVLPGAP